MVANFGPVVRNRPNRPPTITLAPTERHYFIRVGRGVLVQNDSCGVVASKNVYRATPATSTRFCSRCGTTVCEPQIDVVLNFELDITCLGRITPTLGSALEGGRQGRVRPRGPNYQKHLSTICIDKLGDGASRSVLIVNHQRSLYCTDWGKFCCILHCLHAITTKS